MAAVALPVGLPSGIDPESTDVKTVSANTGVGTSNLEWTVPGGEAWLVQAISAKVTSVAPVTSWGLVQYLDQSRNIVYWAEDGKTVTAPATYWQSAALYQVESTVAPANISAVAFGLPFLVLMPGWHLDFSIGTQGAGSASFQALNHFATVTFWDWGSISAGGGAEASGPFLYVPGPETVAA